MDFIKTIAIFVPGVLPLSMIDCFVDITLTIYFVVNSILIGVKCSSFSHTRYDHGTDSFLLNIRQNP